MVRTRSRTRSAEDETEESNPPELVWEWKREAVQYLQPCINLYFKSPKLYEIRSTLHKVGGQQLVDKFMEGQFGHLFNWKGGKSSAKVLHGIVSREIQVEGGSDDELWFRISDTNIRLSVFEYALVSGFKFGQSDFDPTAAHCPAEVEAFKVFCEGSPVDVNYLLKKFIDMEVDVARDDLYLRVANILVLYYFAIGYPDSRVVEPWVWVLVDDLKAWNNFPWGAYTFRALLHYMKQRGNTCAEVNPKNHFPGPVWALEVWAFEAIPDLGIRFADEVEPEAFSRCLKWKLRAYPKDEDTENTFDVFFQERHVCIWKLVPDDNESATSYWRSVQDSSLPLGVNYVVPSNPVCLYQQGQPSRRCSGNTVKRGVKKGSKRNADTIKDAEKQKKGKKLRTKRPQAPSSSSSSSDDSERRRNRFHDMDFMERFTDMQVKKFKQEILPDLKSFLTDLFVNFQSSSSRPGPRPMPSPIPSPARNNDVEDGHQLGNSDAVPVDDSWDRLSPVQPSALGAENSGLNIRSPHHSMHMQEEEEAKEASTHSETSLSVAVEEIIVDKMDYGEERSRPVEAVEPDCVDNPIQENADNVDQEENKIQEEEIEHDFVDNRTSSQATEGNADDVVKDHEENCLLEEDIKKILSQLQEEIPDADLMGNQGKSREEDEREIGSEPVGSGISTSQAVQGNTNDAMEDQEGKRREEEEIVDDAHQGTTSHPSLVEEEKQGHESEGDEVEECIDTNLLRPSRSRKPSAALCSPFDGTGCPFPFSNNIKAEYGSYLRGRRRVSLNIFYGEKSWSLPNNFFSSIEQNNPSQTKQAVQFFILSLIQRVIGGNGDVSAGVTATNTTLYDQSLFAALNNEWRSTVRWPDSKRHEGSDLDYDNWIPPEELIKEVDGSNGNGRPWSGAKQILMVCYLDDLDHYIIVRFCMESWQLDLFDPVWCKMSLAQKKKTKVKLRPITRFIPRLLEVAGYWGMGTANEIGQSRRRKEIPIVEHTTADQFQEKGDDNNSWLFACMHAERLISGFPSISWGNANVRHYRKHVCLSIFNLKNKPAATVEDED